MNLPARQIADRRRARPASQSPLQMLAAFPPLVLLERLPVAVLAVQDDGTIVYSNDAFATMVGRCRTALTTMTLTTLLPSVPVGPSGVVAALRKRAGSVVEIQHAEGWAMSVLMSGSALLRHDDQVALTTFVDISEQLWHTGVTPRPTAELQGAISIDEAAAV